MDPLVASIVGSWVIESDRVTNDYIFSFDTMRQFTIPPRLHFRTALIYHPDHDCSLELTGTCPKCEYAIERKEMFENYIEICRGALLGNFLPTCRAAVEHTPTHRPS